MADQCASAPAATLDQIGPTAEQMLKAVGANANCTTKSSVDQDNGSSSSVDSTQVNVTTKVGIPLLGDLASNSVTGGSSSGEQSQYNKLKQNMEQSGCGSMFVNAENIVNQTNIINCAVKKSMSSSKSSVSAGAAINIESLGVDPNSKAGILLLESVRDITKAIMLTDADIGPNKLKFLEGLVKNVREAIAPDVSINDSKLIMAVKCEVSTSCTLSAETKSQIAAAQKNIADSAAKALIESQNGNQAASSGQLTMIQKKTENLTNQANNDLQETVNSLETNVSANGVINIIAKGPICLKNVTFDQNICASLITNMIVNNAIQAGLSAGGETMTKSTSEGQSSQKNAGADSQTTAAGDAAAKGIAANGKAAGDNAGALGKSLSGLAESGGKATDLGNGSLLNYLCILLILCVGCIVFYKVFKGGSSSQPYPPQGYPPQGYPPQGYPPQGYPPQGFPPQGFPPQGFPPQGFPPQAGPPGYMPLSGGSKRFNQKVKELKSLCKRR